MWKGGGAKEEEGGGRRVRGDGVGKWSLRGMWRRVGGGGLGGIERWSLRGVWRASEEEGGGRKVRGDGTTAEFAATDVWTPWASLWGAAREGETERVPLAPERGGKWWRRLVFWRR